MATMWVFLWQFKHYLYQYPEVFKLAEIALVLPVSTAQAERAFSTQNLIKTRQRNSLGEGHLADLMRISLNGPTADKFNYQRALDVWGSSSTTTPAEGGGEMS